MGEQLDEIEARVEAAGDGVSEALAEELDGEIEAFREALEDTDEALGDASAGAFMWNTIQGASGPPTDDQLWWIDRSWEEVPPIVEQVNAMLTGRLPALYDRMAEEGVRPEAGEPVAVPRRGGGG